MFKLSKKEDDILREGHSQNWNSNVSYKEEKGNVFQETGVFTQGVC